ncbi:hypothetical protein BOTBODRAFT_190914 [Botryobasidium botryosum FD-172 SS1]|uniref:NAD(P)-binding protein n=1 Tax=Botryobasidium botryosum (strain FD-172 SS1) TaxID=930990 RepID=A0A067MDP4_BOTB1|nr:hypothetical protein BOTBODRAFT_190914 [Botryobasidium botryosum FD-172 SS1]
MADTITRQPLVWLVTGTSSGLGNALSRAILARGDTVIATSRKSSAELAEAGAYTLPLDVTWGLEKLKEIVDGIVKQHSRIDVLVNNAGYAMTGALEEATPEETLDLFNSNVFGGLNVARAVLPHMRARKVGTVLWVGSLAGWTTVPYCGLYTSTKFATRSIAETLNVELSSISENLRSIYLEPGYFRTTFLSPGHRSDHNPRIGDYTPLTDKMDSIFKSIDQNQPGDPQKYTTKRASVVYVQLLIDFVKGEGKFAGKKVPVGLAVGSDSYKTVSKTCKDTLQVLEEWEDVIKSTDFPKEETA